MASNTTLHRRRKNALSFSTANIGTSPSQGSQLASLASPSQLVLGYAAGKLVRTPIRAPNDMASQLEDRESPKSPTPGSRVSPLAQPQAPVNHPSRALGDKSSLSPFATPSPLFRSQHQRRSKPAAMEAIGDWALNERTLVRGATDLPASRMVANRAAATAAQPTSTSVSNEVDFDNFLDLPEEGEAAVAAVPGQESATSAPEALLTTGSEFPVGTGADKEQWKTAVLAKSPSTNPFNLSLPARATRRSTSDVTSTETADFNTNFAEMMATLETSAPADPSNSTDNADQQSAQLSSPEMEMGQTFSDMLSDAMSIDPNLETWIPSTNYSMAQENMTGAVDQTDEPSTLAQNNMGVTTSLMSSASDPTHITHSIDQGNTGNSHGSAAQSGKSSSQQPFDLSSHNNGFDNNQSFPEPHMTGFSSQATSAASMTGSSPPGQLNTGANMMESTTQSPPANYGIPPPRISSYTASPSGNILSIPGGYNMSFVPPTSNSILNDAFTTALQAFAPQTSQAPSLPAAPGMHSLQSGMTPGYNYTPNNSMGSQAGQTGPPSLSMMSSAMGSQLNYMSLQASNSMSSSMESASQMGTQVSNMMSPAIGSVSHMSPPALTSVAPAMRRSSIGSIRSATPNPFPLNNTLASSPPAGINTAAMSSRSNSMAPLISDTSAQNPLSRPASPNPLHPAAFYADTTRDPNVPLVTVGPNPLHPPSFHQPTPRAKWPTTRVPIPHNPAVSGNTPGYFQPGQSFNVQDNLGSNMDTDMGNNMMDNMGNNMGNDMMDNVLDEMLEDTGIMQYSPENMLGSQFNNSMSQTTSQNSQMPGSASPNPKSNPQTQYRQSRAFHDQMDFELYFAKPRAIQFPPGYRPKHDLFDQKIRELEERTPLNTEESEEYRLNNVAKKIWDSLKDKNLNAPMPFDGKPPIPLSDILKMDPRIERKKNTNGDDIDDPLAIDLLTVVERFECDFCAGQPMAYGVGLYSDGFIPIWAPLGHDWCKECLRTGKNRVAVVEDDADDDAAQVKKDKKGKSKAKRPAKESAGPTPSPKKPNNSSSCSSSKDASGSSSNYDRYRPMTHDSNVFGDPQEIFSSIDNILINPFMHNLICRGAQYRQIDPQKTKICERCKLMKKKVVDHGCHREFSHIVAVTEDGSWEFASASQASGRPGPGPSQFDGSADVDGDMDFERVDDIDVDADLMNGFITFNDIFDALTAGLDDNGMNDPDLRADVDFSINSNGMLDSGNRSIDMGGQNIDLDGANWNPTRYNPLPANQSTASSSNLLQDSAQTPDTANTYSDHHLNIHMNRKPYGPISKSCMVCPSPAVFLCDGCPLTLCEACRYKLTDMCGGWLNNLIYTNGVNHNRNDTFLLRSDNGGYHAYGKFWPLPGHLNLAG